VIRKEDKDSAVDSVKVGFAVSLTGFDIGLVVYLSSAALGKKNKVIWKLHDRRSTYGDEMRVSAVFR
jgi:hypothetical protein